LRRDPNVAPPPGRGVKPLLLVCVRASESREAEKPERDAYDGFELLLGVDQGAPSRAEEPPESCAAGGRRAPKLAFPATP